MDGYFSQWVLDTIGIIATFLLWFPLFLGCLFFIGFLIYATIQDEHLKIDYLRRCTPEDKKVIEDYIENTNYLRVKRRLRRIKKNLGGNK